MTDFAAMRGFIDHLVDFGARELELTLVMQTDTLRAQTAAPDKTVLAGELVDLYSYATDKGLLVHGDWVDPFHRILATHKFRSEERIAQPLGASCSATSHQISLEPTGDMFPCRAMSSHYGHIDDLDAVLHSDAYRDVVMRTYFNVPACRNCELEGFCQGTCLGSAEEANKDIYKPQEDYCQLYRLTTRLLLNTLEPETMSEESVAYA
jgi:radical SAM protein with 4Fe4S-binding SPASM domain